MIDTKNLYFSIENKNNYLFFIHPKMNQDNIKTIIKIEKYKEINGEKY